MCDVRKRWYCTYRNPTVILIASMIVRLFSQFKYLICFSGLPDQRWCCTVGSQLSFSLFSTKYKKYRKNGRNIQCFQDLYVTNFTKVCFCEGPVTTRKFYVGFVKLYIPCMPVIQVSQVNYYHVKMVAFVYA